MVPRSHSRSRARGIFGNLRENIGMIGRSCRVALAAACLLAFCIGGQAQAAPAGCAALQAKYPAWKGKTLVNAINPHTPGYEAIDPNDPGQICRVRHRSRRRDRRMPRLQAHLQGGDVRSTSDDAGQRTGRHRDLRHLCHRRTRQGGRLHHLLEGVRRRAGRQGQPEENHRHQHVAVRRGGGREHRLCRNPADPGAGPRNARPRASPSRRSSSTTTMPTASRRSSPAAPTPISTTSTPSTRR